MPQVTTTSPDLESAVRPARIDCRLDHHAAAARVV